MLVSATTVTKIVLELDETEARWLKRLVQNPLGVGLEHYIESVEDIRMRHKFFNVLPVKV